jgi:hypothetical protein
MISRLLIFGYLIVVGVSVVRQLSDRIQLGFGWPEWTSLPLMLLLGVPLIYIAGLLAKGLKVQDAR